MRIVNENSKELPQLYNVIKEARALLANFIASTLLLGLHKIYAMMTNLSFTSNQLVLGIVLGMATIFAIIFAFKWYYRHQSNSNLTTKYADKKWRSPLTARNKYPDVDVFKLSPVFLRLGLISALLLTIAAFNWTQYHEVIEQEEIVFSIEEDVEIDIPRSTEPPPPPPPPPPPVIQEVPEELVMEEDEIEFVDQSVDAETAIEIPETFVANTDAPPPPPPPPPPTFKDDAREIFVVVEKMPRFPGCEDIEGDDQAKKACADQKLMEFLGKNIRYPGMAIENGIQGSVVVSFVIEKDGSITNAELLRDIGGGCGEEALRLINSMNDGHKWIPGKQRGRNVTVRFTLPIRFTLQEFN
ncbi:MAG TPA: energy transducer TonB [Saprospiraceae bacterium]|nr:energy transducer TonB [Saprospiraceae bacterium]